jgi:hypothetical protein
MKTYVVAFSLATLAFVPLSKEERLSPLRSAAIHECSIEAEKYVFHVWQSAQFAVYGACMAEHRQRFD